MTGREKQIIDLITMNPLISQDEIAAKLKITRSSVSVYITNMMKKGLIVGRGYILDKEKDSFPVCIGTLAVDFFGYIEGGSEDKILFDNADLQISYGGCAKNLAENLSLLDYKPLVISAVGNDVLGKELLNECTREGIDVSNVEEIKEKNTASYLEIRRPNNSLYMGLSNWRIDYELTPDVFRGKHRILNKADKIIIDDSIPVESIKYLSHTYGKSRLVLQSTARLPVIKDVISTLGLLITDAAYLADMFEIKIEGCEMDTNLAKEIALKLKQADVTDCLFTFGRESLCWYHDNKLYRSNAKFNDLLTEQPIHQRFGTARAAITAVMIYAIDHNYPVESILRHVACARHHVAVYGRISSYLLTPDFISRHLNHLEDNLQIFPIY